MAVAHESFGGTLATRMGIYTLGLMVFYALPKSWLAARRGDFAAHRVWAIRTWGWAGSVSFLFFSSLDSSILASFLHFIYGLDTSCTRTVELRE